MSFVYIIILGFVFCYIFSCDKELKSNKQVLDDAIYTSIIFIIFFSGTIVLSTDYHHKENVAQAKATVAFDEVAKLAAPNGYQVIEFYAPITVFRTRKIYIKYALSDKPSNFAKYYDKMTAKQYWVKTGNNGQYEKGNLSMKINPDDEHGTCSVEVSCP